MTWSSATVPAPSSLARRTLLRAAVGGATGRRVLLGLAALAAGLPLTGCIEDSDCGVCDPDNLQLQVLGGINYAAKRVLVLNGEEGLFECEGEACPSPLSRAEFFVDDVIPCTETEEAQASPRGAEAYCKLSPLVTTGGIEFVFNNLLEATTVEQVRKNPSNPNIFQVYDWRADVVHLDGPITRYNGDYFTGTGNLPSRSTRSVNLSCIDNLRLEGIPFDSTSLEDPATNPCNAVGADGRPRKLWAQADAPAGFPRAEVRSYRGLLDWRAGSCAAPGDGPDTCCSAGDFERSVNVGKYGATAAQDPLAPDPAAKVRPEQAIACDPAGDPYQQCRPFVPWVDRSDEVVSYRYPWASPDETPQLYKLPYYDRLRETHPDDRPDWLRRRNTPCTRDRDCTAGSPDLGTTALPGTACIGELPDGSACLPGSENPECTNGRCEPEWFVGCVDVTDTLGAAANGLTGRCVDDRFSDRAAPACFEVTAGYNRCDPEDPTDCDFVAADGGGRARSLALADWDSDGFITAAEGCQDELGSPADGAACDPLFQPNVRATAQFTRDSNLPAEVQGCFCVDNGPEQCNAVVDQLCRDANGNIRAERQGEYAHSFVSEVGGIVYDPAAKGVRWIPADIGGQRRALLETAAEAANQIGGRNVQDGWRANDLFTAHLAEDFNRAMCSGQDYTVVFNTPGDDGGAIRDKVGNDLSGQSVYTFSTTDFHIVPDSGFPTENLQVGACDTFALKVSNQYDLSVENQKKIQLWEVDANDALVRRVAGGPDCRETKAEIDASGGVPCMIVDVGVQIHRNGEFDVQIDPIEFQAVLDQNTRYRMIVPGLTSSAEITDAECDPTPIDQRAEPALATCYQEAFWDVCGMPLVLGATRELQDEGRYVFTVDPASCAEDEDQDGIERSCDNSPTVFNPDQVDTDRDGFGDASDLCPLTPSAVNTSDSDKDGVGNDCDRCQQSLNVYNRDADDNALRDYMRVRNIPFQSDVDQDGIGDVCDNCIFVPNCEDYGPSNPYNIGDPIDVQDDARCQADANANMIGEACEGVMQPGAAGPIGFGDNDDFDQDGLRNLVDRCPRQPVDGGTPISCTTDAECGDGRTCETSSGICNHVDADGDGTGDQCDTCPFQPNTQIPDGAAQEDDSDGDFVGEPCEPDSDCTAVPSPRRYGFHRVAVNGFCCTTEFTGNSVPCTVDTDCGAAIVGTAGLKCDIGGGASGENVCNPVAREVDDEGLVIELFVRPGCTEEQEDANLCRRLPQSVIDAPGVVDLPPGCDAALAAAGITQAENEVPLTPADLPGGVEELFGFQCFLPPRDQDFDGVGDACDLCEYAFDPSNAFAVDPVTNRVFVTAGAACSYQLDPEELCDVDEPGVDTDTDGGTDTDGAGTDTN
jgi:hypothetical protein